MLPEVERAREKELLWPRSMIEQLEDLDEGRGFRWASDRILGWIEVAKPDRCEELIGLINFALNADRSTLDEAALCVDARRIWFLWSNDVFPQRAVSRLYEALAALARNDRKLYLSSLAAGVFIAATKDSFTEAMYCELQASFADLIAEQSLRESDDQTFNP